MAMRRRILYSGLIFLLIAIISFFLIPRSLIIAGGSCNQGIGIAIHVVVLMVSGGLNLLAFALTALLNRKSNYIAGLSILAFIIWIIYFTVMLIDGLIACLYLLPFLIACYLAKRELKEVGK